MVVAPLTEIARAPGLAIPFANLPVFKVFLEMNQEYR